MKKGGIVALGNHVFDYLIGIIVFNLSALLVIPWISLIVGFQTYVETDRHSRSLSMIPKTIKENLAIILRLTIFVTLAIGFSMINIRWLNTEWSIVDQLIKGLSYLVLWLTVTLMIYAPTIIIHMHVTFKELMINALLLIFGGIGRYALTLLILAGFIYLSLQSIMVLVFGLPLIMFISSSLAWLNFKKIKEKMK